MKKTAYVWDTIVPATRELETYLNDGYEVVSSQLFESEEDCSFAAVLVKEVK